MERFHFGSIKNSVFISFTITALVALVITGIVFYMRFSKQLDTYLRSENETLIEEVTQSISVYLRDMIRLSDSIYYNVIKGTDLSEESIADSLQLLYSANNNYVKDIFVFDRKGTPIAAVPPSLLKENVDITSYPWFQNALQHPENLHFSTPCVQNFVSQGDNPLNWVMSLSCSVELTYGKITRQGVLLIDLSMNGLAEAFRNQRLSGDGYIYLMDAGGRLISHPKQPLIDTGILKEDNLELATLKDGFYTRRLNGETRSVILRSVGYTGWRVVGVIPKKNLALETKSNILFVALIVLILLEFLLIINAVISSRLTDPIKKLDLSVQELERGLDTEIQAEGSDEVQHLGKSIQSMVIQLREMTEQMVRDHQLKQKSELNALQVQINPHFLYNTLDIIVWMIENERKDNAINLVTALARLFRISLSQGKNIITVADELEHVRNYLIIQSMRYKNKFTYTIEAPPEILGMSVIKLIIQPLVENAIYHGMDFMDGDGIIDITGRLENGDVYLTVSDNGMGIQEEILAGLLDGHGAVSGFGLKNVNERVKLYFGEDYGLSIESEPDVGTSVTVHLPAVPFCDASLHLMEEGHA